MNFLCARPGFPKDSPSNLAWLPEKATADADAFLLTAKLPADAPTPKLRVILRGDGQRDVLCGGPWCSHRTAIRCARCWSAATNAST